MVRRGDFMIKLTDKEKSFFYTQGNAKDYVLDFKEIGLKITNETIHEDAVTIKESICEEQEFTLGGCIASSLEFEVSDIIQHDLSGLEFNADFYVDLKDDGTSQLHMPMGIYRVDSVQMVDNRDYKKVIAYDRLYDASADVSAWYSEYFSENKKHSVRETREALLQHLRIPFKNQELINDDVLIEKTIETSGQIPGTAVLKKICEINGGFGKMGRDGRFEVITLSGLGLFPEDALSEAENLYPANDLWPEDYFEGIGIEGGPEYTSVKFEEYMTLPPTCVTIRTTEDDYGTTSGDDLSNPYIISGNFFLYGKPKKELITIAGKVLRLIKEITYRPAEINMWDGLPYLEAGDVIEVENETLPVETYIFSRTLSGIYGMKDKYEAKGSEVRANEVGANEEVSILKGRVLILKKSIDGVSSELTDFAEDTTTRFNQTDEAIELEAKRAEEAEASLRTTADSIVSTVSKTTKNYDTTGYEIQNFGYGEPSKDIGNEGEYYLDQEEGNLYKKIGGIWSFAKKLQSVQESAESRIEQTAASITSTVSGAMDIWDTTGVTVNLYGFGAPNAENGYPPEQYSGQYYLDQNTGNVYFATYQSGYPSGSHVWSLNRTLKKITTNLSTRIAQTLTSIELGVTSNDKTIGIEITSEDGNGKKTTENGSITLTGLVNFNDLSGNGTTTINGANIKTGTIDCSLLNGGVINGQTINGGTINGTTITTNSLVILDNIQMASITDGTPMTIFNYIPQSKSVYLTANVSQFWVQAESYINNDTHFMKRPHFDLGPIPSADGLTPCGTGNYRWSNVYSKNGEINTSDRNRKKNISEISEQYEKLWELLEPVTYQFIDGDRTHCGYISQDVENAMSQVGLASIDFAGFCKDLLEDDDGSPILDDDGNKQYLYSMRYIELLPLIDRMLRKAFKRIEALEEIVKKGA